MKLYIVFPPLQVINVCYIFQGLGVICLAFRVRVSRVCLTKTLRPHGTVPPKVFCDVNLSRPFCAHVCAASVTRQSVLFCLCSYAGLYLCKFVSSHQGMLQALKSPQRHDVPLLKSLVLIMSMTPIVLVFVVFRITSVRPISFSSRCCI